MNSDILYKCMINYDFIITLKEVDMPHNVPHNVCEY